MVCGGEDADSSSAVDIRASPGPQGPRLRRHSFLDCKAFLREHTGRFLDEYEIVGDLGEGAFGDVWLAQQRVRAHTLREHGGRLVAVKRMRKILPTPGPRENVSDEGSALDAFRLEIDLMRSLDHPNICRLFEVYEDPRNLFLVMEHIEGGELFARIVQHGHMEEYDAAQVTKQVASALAYCHQHGVVHRDVKPENILVVNPSCGQSGFEDDLEITVKLIDFGFGCRMLQGAQLKAKVGTFVYTAPEVLNGQPCDEKIDVWALGCVIFAMLSGSIPFSGLNSREHIMSGCYSMEGKAWMNVSEDAKAVIRGLLVVSSKERISAVQVLRHPWLAKDDLPSPNDRQKGVLRHLRIMKTFRHQGLLRHLCATVLAQQLDASQLHELRRSFCAVDEDGDGALSLEEFIEAWRRFQMNGQDIAACPSQPFGSGSSDTSDKRDTDSQEALEVFRSVDMDGSGKIDYTEFLAACLDQRFVFREDSCWAAFQVFDADGDGLVSFDELRRILNNASLEGTPFSNDILLQLWEELTGSDVDAATTDRIDFDAFMAACRGTERLCSKNGHRSPIGRRPRVRSIAGSPPPVIPSSCSNCRPCKPPVSSMGHHSLGTSTCPSKVTATKCDLRYSHHHRVLTSAGVAADVDASMNDGHPIEQTMAQVSTSKSPNPPLLSVGRRTKLSQSTASQETESAPGLHRADLDAKTAVTAAGLAASTATRAASQSPLLVATPLANSDGSVVAAAKVPLSPAACKPQLPILARAAASTAGVKAAPAAPFLSRPPARKPECSAGAKTALCPLLPIVKRTRVAPEFA